MDNVSLVHEIGLSLSDVRSQSISLLTSLIVMNPLMTSDQLPIHILAVLISGSSMRIVPLFVTCPSMAYMSH